MHPSPMLWLFNARFIMLSWTCFGKFSHVILHLPTWRHHKVISAVPRLTRPWPNRRWTCQVGGCNGPADWFQICSAHDTARPLMVESKEWDRPPIDWCRIFSISISWLFFWFEIYNDPKFPDFLKACGQKWRKGFWRFWSQYDAFWLSLLKTLRFVGSAIFCGQWLSSEKIQHTTFLLEIPMTSNDSC